MHSKIWSNNKFLIDGSDLWFVSCEDNLLCCYSLESKTVKIMERIRSSSKLKHPYANLCNYKNKIYLIPMNADNIGIYIIDKHTFDYIDISEIKHEDDIFMECAIFEDYLYCFPDKYPSILKVNLITKEKKYIKDWAKNFPVKPKKSIFCHKCSRFNEKIYLLSALTNKMMRFDFNTDEVHVFSVGQSGELYSAYQFINDEEVLLISKTGNACIFNIKSGSVKQIGNPDSSFYEQGFDSTKAVFSDVIIKNKTAYVFPTQGNTILEINLEEYSVRESHLFGEIYSKICDTKDKGEWFSHVECVNDLIYTFRMDKQEFCKYDMSLEIYEEYAIYCEYSNNVEQVFRTKVVGDKKSIGQEIYKRTVYS